MSLCFNPVFILLLLEMTYVWNVKITTYFYTHVAAWVMSLSNHGDIAWSAVVQFVSGKQARDVSKWTNERIRLSHTLGELALAWKQHTCPIFQPRCRALGIVALFSWSCFPAYRTFSVRARWSKMPFKRLVAPRAGVQGGQGGNCPGPSVLRGSPVMTFFCFE